MKNSKEKALEEFLNDEEKDGFNDNIKDKKEYIVRERTGLIERVDNDRILITKDGKQLLREQY